MKRSAEDDAGDEAGPSKRARVEQGGAAGGAGVEDGQEAPPDDDDDDEDQAYMPVRVGSDATSCGPSLVLSEPLFFSESRCVVLHAQGVHSRLNKEKRAARECPFLDTVNRQALDFDFEKCCSVTLSPHNVYACLVRFDTRTKANTGRTAHPRAARSDPCSEVALSSRVRCVGSISRGAGPPRAPTPTASRFFTTCT